MREDLQGRASYVTMDPQPGQRRGYQRGTFPQGLSHQMDPRPRSSGQLIDLTSNGPTYRGGQAASTESMSSNNHCRGTEAPQHVGLGLFQRQAVYGTIGTLRDEVSINRVGQYL